MMRETRAPPLDCAYLLLVFVSFLDMEHCSLGLLYIKKIEKEGTENKYQVCKTLFSKVLTLFYSFSFPFAAASSSLNPSSIVMTFL